MCCKQLLKKKKKKKKRRKKKMKFIINESIEGPVLCEVILIFGVGWLVGWLVWSLGLEVIMSKGSVMEWNGMEWKEDGLGSAGRYGMALLTLARVCFM